MQDSEDYAKSINSDVPRTDPKDDAFGYAPLSKRIADSISQAQSPYGLVMSIHGPWGVGKTTAINFVKHYLIEDYGESQRPIIIDFNPWWFSNREQLADQFIQQFQLGLRTEKGYQKSLRKLGQLLGNYGSSLSSAAVTISGAPGWLGKLLDLFWSFFKPRPRDIPRLKQEVSEEIRKTGKRFLFVIDDIDRLPPDEMCEVFKVIKALADFPNVIYLLSFDRALVAKSLGQVLSVDGDEYLEKIVQTQFHLPHIGKHRLRNVFTERFNEILAALPSATYDETYWWNIYMEGLEQYLNKPRDLVRITNSLSVLLPSMIREVNLVDFVAIEFLRNFEPLVYDTIRNEKDLFTGATSGDSRRDLDRDKSFHAEWIKTVSTVHQDGLKRMMSRLFPKLAGIWGNQFFGSDWRSGWRRDLRICSPEIFDTYFQFGVTAEVVSTAEMEDLLDAALEPGKFGALLLEAFPLKNSDGESKAYSYLDRLRDKEQHVTKEIAQKLLWEIFNVGDALAFPEQSHRRAFGLPNHWQVSYSVNLLLTRIPSDQREEVLATIFADCKAICLATFCVSYTDDAIREPEKAGDQPLELLGKDGFEHLSKILVQRFNAMEPEAFLELSSLSTIIYSWSRWEGKESVSSKLSPLLESVDSLPKFLEKLLSWGSTFGMGDSAARRIPYLDPKELLDFTDLDTLADHIVQMLNRTDLTTDQRVAGKTCLRNLQRMKEGKHTNEPFRDWNEDEND